MRRVPWFFFGGVAVFVCGLFIESFLTMTGLLGVMLGASVAGFGSGVFTRGLWFLAALIWLSTVFIYAGMSYLHIWHLIEHPSDIVRLASLAVATWLLAVQSRFLLTVTAANWRLSRRHSE